MLSSKHYLFASAALIGLLLLPPMTSARADVIGEQHNFFVNQSFDLDKSSNAPATLELIGQHAYYYIDNRYLDSLSPASHQAMEQSLVSLASEFDNNIYPKETAFWGSEPNPGIDNDSHITILLEELQPNTGGYFDSTNGYSTSIAPNSNEREMLMLNVDSLGRGDLDVFLAHEMQHLISFNQKDLLHHVSEDTWLNELRSQYAVTVAGYNDTSSGSDLEERAVTFIHDPTDSLTEWPNTDQDYASATLFGEYLVERFGTGILTDTLHSPLVGIDSIDAWLASHGYNENFQNVFADWELANYLNDVADYPPYGYTRPELTQIQVPPTQNIFLNYPSSNSFETQIKPWQPEWYRFVISGTASGSLQVSWNSPSVSMLYYDNLNRIQEISNPSSINQVAGLRWFVLMPVDGSQRTNFGASETPADLDIVTAFGASAPNAVTDTTTSISPLVHDGSLIMHQGAPDVYVVTGNYKRRLDPAVLAMYGLNVSQAVTVPESVFDRYITSNYVRAIDDKKVYALWPDGTKHWLNMSAATFSSSGRDWNSVFIINDSEKYFYQTGNNITQ